MVRLQEGDVIRFGRIPFKASRICFNQNSNAHIDGPGRFQLPQ